ncbi:MAG: sulfatase-like hydrolase/transferase [Gemmatimonadota bacterium]
MSDPLQTQSPPNPGLVHAVLTAVYLALIAGLLEVGVLAVNHSTRPIMGISGDYPWLTPLAVLLPGLLGCAGGYILGRLVPKLDPARTAVFLTSCAIVLELLLLVPRIHPAATVILAIGLVTVLKAADVLCRPAAVRFAPRLAVTSAVVVLALAAGPRLVGAVTEARAIAALPPSEADAPNVIIITLDTVRSRSLSLYGYGRATSPFLEELGARGVVFDQAIAPSPWTLPSHAALFTGRWHHELSVGYRTPLDGTFPTLAEHMAGAGYVTAGFVANLRYVGYETGLARGFVRYEDYDVSLGELLLSGRITRRFVSSFRIRKLMGTDEHPNRKTADELGEDVLRWLDQDLGRPFFLFLNYFDAHEPYLPPAPYDTRFGTGRANRRLSPLHRWLYDPAVNHAPMDQATIQEEIDAYDGALAYLDDRLRELFEALPSAADGRRTLVVITADHGEEFGEHGVFEHGYSLYRPSVRVPLLIVMLGDSGPPPGVRVDEPVSIRDVPATVLDLLGHDGPFPGRPLRTVWEAAAYGTGEGEPTEASARPTPVFSELAFSPNQPEWFPVSAGTMRSVVIDGLRYILNGDGSEELYDYPSDPEETNNLIGDARFAEALARARALLPTSELGRD